MEKSIKQFDAFIRSIKKAEKIAICHDLDADGVCAGALAFVAIKKIRNKKPDLVITQKFKTVELLDSTIDLLSKKKIDTLICVDFALDQQPESIRRALKIVKKIVVIDHHKEYGFSGKGVLIIKANHYSEIDSSKYPASKFVFDLFSRHVDLSEKSWIACVGLMGDNQLEQWKPFVLEVEKQHSTSVQEMFSVTKTISSVEVLAPNKLNKMLLFISSCTKPREVLESDFGNYEKKLDEMVSDLFKKFSSDKESFHDLDLIWFEFKSKKNIKSALINKISNEVFPNKTVIVVQDKGDGYVSFSARRQDFKLRVNDLLEQAVEGFEDAGAGGHIPAAAGRIKKKDLANFKERIINFLKDNRDDFK